MHGSPILAYAIAHGLSRPADAWYLENALLALYRMDAPAEWAALPDVPVNADCTELLAAYTALARQRGLLSADSPAAQDAFAARLMGLLTMPPSQVRETFAQLQQQSAKAATDWLYQLCLHNGYIQAARTAKNVCWQVQTAYGPLDMTINCAKPEKDPRAIAAAGKAVTHQYPACQLCVENEGYAGRGNHPARQNLRMVPVTLQKADGSRSQWFLQFSPYAYFAEHCIVLDRRHTPMQIGADCFAELLDFVRQFPHYLVGSNADLPIVGGSILSHAHFQGGNDVFPMSNAPLAETVPLAEFSDVSCGILAWPMTVLRLRGTDPARLVQAATAIHKAWQRYSDPSLELVAYTGDTPHHTITPIARYRADAYELDLMLRDNHTTAAHPLGLFHPHAELHHIKQENIGLIEGMGLAILPARLKTELAAVVDCLQRNGDLLETPETAKHAAWVATWRTAVPRDCQWEEVVKAEVGKVFLRVLAQCGVFPDTPEGRAGCLRFLQTVGVASDSH